uniref:Uncharacterized protein n=1 Tax=Acrobeloides nanus TaxID=290746 RepID=A0A914D2I6_9BILA
MSQKFQIVSINTIFMNGNLRTNVRRIFLLLM